MNHQFKKKNHWSIYEIVLGSKIVCLWVVFGIINVYFKILTNGTSIPIFYFLIWISGLFFSPHKAFLITFTGHFLFDFYFFLHPLSILIWLISAIWSFSISWFRNKRKFSFLFAFLFPFFYILVFFIFAKFTYNDSFLRSSIKYFGSNFFLSLIIFVINPFFSLIIFYFFSFQKAFINFYQYGNHQLQ